MRNECASSGRMWTILTLNESCGMSRKQSNAIVLSSASGMLMHIDFAVECLLIICALGRRKCQLSPNHSYNSENLNIHFCYSLEFILYAVGVHPKNPIVLIKSII